VIEQRSDSEITEFGNRRVAPLNARVYNPAFDVTPAELIDAIITERGVLRPTGDRFDLLD
jgi:methylthioribose-1-phosphate isomerase